MAKKARKKMSKLPSGGIPRVQKGMFVWMVAQSDGLLCPDLWDFTRREVRDKAARHRGASWGRLEAAGWSSHRVYIATIPRGFKLESLKATTAHAYRLGLRSGQPPTRR